MVVNYTQFTPYLLFSSYLVFFLFSIGFNVFTPALDFNIVSIDLCVRIEAARDRMQRLRAREK